MCGDLEGLIIEVGYNGPTLYGQVLLVHHSMTFRMGLKLNWANVKDYIIHLEGLIIEAG